MLVADVPWVIPVALYASYSNILADILHCPIPAKTIIHSVSSETPATCTRTPYPYRLLRPQFTGTVEYQQL